MNDYVNPIVLALAVITTFLILFVIIKWLWNKLWRRTPTPAAAAAAAAAAGGTPPPAHTTHASSFSFTLDWVGFAKAVVLVLIIGTLLYFAYGLYGPFKELAARFMTSITPSTTVIDWSSWDYTQLKFWIVVAITLVVIFLIFKLLLATVTAFGRHAPATSTPTNWDSIFRGVFALAVVVCAFFLLRGCSGPATQMFKTLADKISSGFNSDSDSGKSSASSKGGQSEDQEIMKMGRIAREKDIKLLQQRLEHVWHIPLKETNEILAVSGNIPGEVFWRNMTRVYSFKRLPEWKWNTLPSSIVEIQETYPHPQTNAPVEYTYTLPVKLCKDRPSRLIPVRGWDDRIVPADPTVDGSYLQISDRDGSAPVEIYFSGKTGRYYVYNYSGRAIRQDKGWVPTTINQYELMLAPNHPSSGEVRFLIHRTRHSMSPSDPDPLPTRID